MRSSTSTKRCVDARAKRDWSAGTIFTIGHSTRSIEEFIDLLRAYGIERVADIRSVPRSRRNPQFNTEALGPALRSAGIEYEHLKALGGLRHAHKDSPNLGWRNESFRGFADYMQAEAFAEGLERLIELGRTRRVAIMCAEAVPWRCHRSLVADALLVRGVPAVEFLSETSWRDHALTPFARVEGTSITYPPEAPATGVQLIDGRDEPARRTRRHAPGRPSPSPSSR